MSTITEHKKEYQDLMRDVVTLNTDIGEAEKEFVRRFGDLKNKLGKIYCEVNGKLNNTNDKEKPK